MTADYKDYVNGVDKRIGALFKAVPKPMGAYSQLAQSASAGNAIDSKTKELMALSIAIATRCEDCIAFHARAAIGHGAGRDEVAETIAVAVEMGGGPAVVYGGKALQAFDDLSK
ncbi:carboxymuconolactone decarboxylase family protein [Hoeflea sp. TYP-13]|uniref:carboxymuconolactone decarboxylase family protein n=1 Tax=Hoeflea sp. TYP-13 TaxID=3230023 RepID=UPI0034C693C7